MKHRKICVKTTTDRASQLFTKIIYPTSFKRSMAAGPVARQLLRIYLSRCWPRVPQPDSGRRGKTEIPLRSCMNMAAAVRAFRPPSPSTSLFPPVPGSVSEAGSCSPSPAECVCKRVRVRSKGSSAQARRPLKARSDPSGTRRCTAPVPRSVCTVRSACRVYRFRTFCCSGEATISSMCFSWMLPSLNFGSTKWSQE